MAATFCFVMYWKILDDWVLIENFAVLSVIDNLGVRQIRVRFTTWAAPLVFTTVMYLKITATQSDRPNGPHHKDSAASRSNSFLLHLMNEWRWHACDKNLIVANQTTNRRPSNRPLPAAGCAYHVVCFSSWPDGLRLCCCTYHHRPALSRKSLIPLSFLLSYPAAVGRSVGRSLSFKAYIIRRFWSDWRRRATGLRDRAPEAP